MRIINPYIRIFRITNPKEPRISICNALYNAERIYQLSIIHYQLSIELWYSQELMHLHRNLPLRIFLHIIDNHVAGALELAPFGLEVEFTASADLLRAFLCPFKVGFVENDDFQFVGKLVELG